MRKLSLIILLCSIVISLFGQTRLISVEDAQVIANQNAAVLWENVSPGEPIIYYSADDNIVAYRFNYAINKPFPNEDVIKQECTEGKNNGNRKAQWGNGNYGKILMSARTDLPVTLEYGLGVSPEYAYNEYIQQQAEAHLGPNYSLKRIYFINTVSIWHQYTNGSKDIYVNAHPPAKVADHDEFQTTISEKKFFCKTSDFNDQWDQYLNGDKVLSKATNFIAYHDECCPFYDWSYGCSPTAAAMLYGYWDNMSMYSNWKFSKFVDYHFERYDPVQEDIDSHCPNVLPNLAMAMNTTTGGATDRDDIAPGYNQVSSDHGYSFSFSKLENSIWIPFFWTETMNYIDADKPMHLSIEGHSVLGVAYVSDDEMIGTHYTHQPEIIWMPRLYVEAIYPYDVAGSDGLGIDLIKPDGDQDYWGNGSGETLYAGDAYEITWDYDESPGSYVHLYYNTDHGKIGTPWETINSNTPNDGAYDWVVPVGIDSDSCRIKISVYTSDDIKVGADGSYGDFQIDPGGSIYTLFDDSKVTTITEPDYYQFSNSYSTWCAVGVRPNTPGEDWNIRLFSNELFDTEWATSDYNAPVNFVVLDHHHLGSYQRGIKAYRTSGIDNASVEFENGQETLSIGTNGSYGWTAGDVVEMYDVYLTPGTYKFDLEIISGSGDLDFALFGSADGFAYKNREAFLARSTNTGLTVGEHFTIAITSADDYGLCVWANDDNSPTYTIDIHDPDPGTWEGDHSQDWGNANNWSFNHLPVDTSNVTIPAGTLHECTLTTGSATCNSLYVSAGAILNVDGQNLYINNNMVIDGSIGMIQNESYIYVLGNIIWNAGSTLNVTAPDSFIKVFGDWNFNAGANVNPQLGNVDFLGTTTEYIRCYSDNCSFHNLRVYKSGGAFLGLSAMSTERLWVNNLTYLNTGSIFNSYSSHGMLMRGSFNYYGTFDFNTGSVTFDGTDIHQFGAESGTFNNVIINSPSGTTHLINGDMTVTGDLTITYGSFNPDTNTIFIAGDCRNNTGYGSFAEGRVVFNGSNGDQYCFDETFNILEIDKSVGNFKVENTDVECAAYDWTAGAVDVTNGSFTANDLIDDGIFGAFYANPGGVINLHQPTGYADLNGDLILTGGGEINIYGIGDSWVPYAANASITMSEGVIDFKSTSLRINDAYTLTNNITGGTIRTAGYFSNYRSDFNLSAGTLEMYGSSEAILHQDIPTNFLHDVVINKVDDDGAASTIIPDKRDGGNPTKGSKANNVDLTSDIHVNHELTISSGSLTLNGNELTVDHDCYVYGILIMDDPADILNVGASFSDRLWFYSGSTGNLDQGVANIYGWFQPETGCSLNGSTNHTTVFKGVNGGGPNNQEPTATYGNIEIYKDAGERTYISGQASQPIVVNGDFTIHPNNEFELQEKTMIVNGLITDNTTSEICVFNPVKDAGKVYPDPNPKDITTGKENEGYQNKSGTKGGFLEIDNGFLLTGLMDVGDGDVLIHGNFETATTGILNIDGGSVICDAPGGTDIWYYLYGAFNMTDGLFEVSNNSINFGSSAVTNISGGILRSGEAFYGMYTGTFLPTGGLVELTGTVNQTSINCSNGNYFHNLTINKDPGLSAYIYGSTTVENNLTVNSGILMVQNNTLSCGSELNINNNGVLNIPDNGTLVMTYNDYIHVNSGGLIEVLGSPGNPATITCSAGHFNFWIENGGTISANYGMFDYVRTNGILLQPGSLVDPVNSFNNCTFQNGNPNGCFMNLNNDQTFTATNVHFPTNTWGSDYNVYKGSGTNPVYFHNTSGGFAGPEFEYDGNNTLHWTTDSYQVDLEVYLQGSYNSSTTQMNTDLKDLDLIPYTQPFDDNPSADWYYTGTETVGTIPDFAVDWVLIELRDATSVTNALPGRAIAQQAAFVTNNGDVMDLDGLPLLEFDAAVFNNLYVNIWHRNHLGVISANSLVNVGGLYSYDFSSGSGQAYGGTSAQVELTPGTWGILGGDSDGDGDIDLLDKTLWLNEAGTSGYLPGDFNLDGQVNNPDKNDIYWPQFGVSSYIPE